MIRGKYLRERKAIRVKRRIKLLIAILILCILHKVLFGSYSIYESEANSEADIEIAFFAVVNEYQTKTISIGDLEPGETTTTQFSISNYYQTESGEQIISETDMEYELKIRTTTNLPVEYKLYKNQGMDAQNLTNILAIESVENENLYLDDDNTIFRHLVLESQSEEDKDAGITDSGTFSYQTPTTNTYTLEISLPEECNSVEYQGIMDCIDISVDAEQIVN